MIMICKHEYFAADDDKRKYSAADDDGKHKYSALEVFRPVSALKPCDPNTPSITS